MSLMYSKKGIYPRTEPCGTPDVTSVMSARAPITETRCLRFDRKYVIQLCALPVIPYDVSLDRRQFVSDFIKRFGTTRRIASICVCYPNAVIQSWTVLYVYALRRFTYMLIFSAVGALVVACDVGVHFAALFFCQRSHNIYHIRV